MYLIVTISETNGHTFKLWSSTLAQWLLVKFSSEEMYHIFLCFSNICCVVKMQNTPKIKLQSHSNNKKNHCFRTLWLSCKLHIDSPFVSMTTWETIQLLWKLKPPPPPAAPNLSLPVPGAFQHIPEHKRIHQSTPMRLSSSWSRQTIVNRHGFSRWPINSAHLPQPGLELTVSKVDCETGW